jgi:hypothetical protein
MVVFKNKRFFSKKMGLLDLVVWIFFLNYIEWSTIQCK